MPPTLENSAVATGVEKVSFHSNPKEGKWQRLFKLPQCYREEADPDSMLELFCFFDDPADVDNLICGSSAFSKTSLNIWKFSVHVLLKPGWRILSITLLACERSAIVQ